MSLEHICNADIPSWAVVYIEYADPCDLTDDEVELIVNWYKSIMAEGFEDLTFNFSEEAGFTHWPEFGLPCDCYETEVWGHPREDK